MVDLCMTTRQDKCIKSEEKIENDGRCTIRDCQSCWHISMAIAAYYGFIHVVVYVRFKHSGKTITPCCYELQEIIVFDHIEL